MNKVPKLGSPLLLDGSLPEEEIIRLLELSYDLTKPAARRAGRPKAE